MKIHNLTLIELTKEEVLRLEPTDQVLVYNPNSMMYRIELANKDCSVRSKYGTLSNMRYFLFNISELPRP